MPLPETKTNKLHSSLVNPVAKLALLNSQLNDIGKHLKQHSSFFEDNVSKTIEKLDEIENLIVRTDTSSLSEDDLKVTFKPMINRLLSEANDRRIVSRRYVKEDIEASQILTNEERLFINELGRQLEFTFPGNSFSEWKAPCMLFLIHAEYTVCIEDHEIPGAYDMIEVMGEFAAGNYSCGVFSAIMSFAAAVTDKMNEERQPNGWTTNERSMVHDKVVKCLTAVADVFRKKQK